MEKILISRCLLGEPVRYDAKSKGLNHQIIRHWQQQRRLVPICPEVIGGLPTPRPPAELNQRLNKVLTESGDDKTAEFTSGANQALALCQKHQIKYALLKERSPSCGSTFIYDGSFKQQLISGQGITTALLREHGVAVYSEETIEQLINVLSKEI